MAPARNSRSIDDVRRDLELEREHLATAADELRDAADLTAKLRTKLPVVAAGAAGAGFLLAGGVGATMRLLFRRGREGSTKARFGRFRVVDDD